MHSPPPATYTPRVIGHDLVTGLVVFLVALPLCLGIALASGAPMVAGLVAGVVGGLVVGTLSGSHTSVSGPAAGLAAVVLSQQQALGSFSTFVLAVALAGVIQLILGLLKAGFLGAFFPNSVIKGLLAAIGLLLILKQLPHVFGHDPDPVGDMEFEQPDGENTFTELVATLTDIHPGAALIGLFSIALLVLWDRTPALKKSLVPGPLVVVGASLGIAELLSAFGPDFVIGANHLVQVPVLTTQGGMSALLTAPDFTQLTNAKVYLAAFTLAIVASLETLLNLEAVDKLDPLGRHSPPNRELFAQGAGNLVAGLLGGLPVTSVVVRGSVNVSAGVKTRVSAISHGVFLACAALLIPELINRIPLSCLAAILLVTGIKLASPALFRRIYQAGHTQFLPFIATVLSIVLVDLLIGVLVGLAVSINFILYSNFKKPLRMVLEHHISQDVLRLQLASQVSFFSRAALERALAEVPPGRHVLIDARETDFIDPDVLDYLLEYKDKLAPARSINVSLVGFRDRYPELPDQLQFVDYTTRDLQNRVHPRQVLALLRQGNERFRSGKRLERNFMRQIEGTAPGQAPLAVVLSCIDSRSPAELLFDLGIGDIFSVRIAGNVARGKILGSMEYGCKVAGAKLLLILGHTSCGAVTAAVDFYQKGVSGSEATGCSNIDHLIQEIQASIDPTLLVPLDATRSERLRAADRTARSNVICTMRQVRDLSSTLRQLLQDGTLLMVGGLYDVASGEVEFFNELGQPLDSHEPDATSEARPYLDAQRPQLMH